MDRSLWTQRIRAIKGITVLTEQAEQHGAAKEMFNSLADDLAGSRLIFKLEESGEAIFFEKTYPSFTSPARI